MFRIETWSSEDTAGREKKQGGFFRPSIGSNRVRMLSRPRQAFVRWCEEDDKGQWLVYPFGQKPAGVKCKFAWLILIWNYEANAPQVWQLTQKTVMDAIDALMERQGCPSGYDLLVEKSGKDLATTYSVSAGDSGAISNVILEGLQKVTIDMDAIFRGERVIEENDGNNPF